MKDASTIVVRASGFYFGADRAVNLGDMAQQVRAVSELRRCFPQYQVVTMANSEKDHSLSLANVFSTDLPAYLGAGSKQAVGMARLLIRAVWFVLNAVSMRIFQRAPIRQAHGRRALNLLNETALLFFSGAGALNQRYLWGVAGTWLLTAVCARILGVPIVLMGQQIGPFDQRFFPRMLFRSAFGSAVYFGCRDFESMLVLQELGIAKSRIYFTGDEGAYLSPAPWLAGIALLTKYGITPGFIAIHLRCDGNCPFGSWIDDFAAIVDEVSSSMKAPVLLVPMGYRGINDDRQALESLKDALECSAETLDCEDPALLKSCLAHASVALGVANHFVVFAASVGVPTVGVYASEYMRQKLEGAARVFPEITAVRMGELTSRQLTDLVIEVARERAECTDPRPFCATMPDGYWDWLDLVAEKGLVASCPEFSLD